MKNFILIIITLASIPAIDFNSSAQVKKQKVCEPSHIIFKNFQRKSLNIYAGAGMSRNKITNRDIYGFNGVAGINYFPANYLEVGFRLKPTRLDDKFSANRILFENNVYLRYYPVLINCYKISFFGGANVFRDGSVFSLKGETISKNIFYPSVSTGIVALIRKRFQLEVYPEFFTNRPHRSNISLTWNIHQHQFK